MSTTPAEYPAVIFEALQHAPTQQNNDPLATINCARQLYNQPPVAARNVDMVCVLMALAYDWSFAFNIVGETGMQQMEQIIMTIVNSLRSPAAPVHERLFRVIANKMGDVV